jgi:UPF0716 protein FxsA
MPALLLLVLVAIPLVEIYVIIQVGHAIGGWWTLLLLVAETFVGAWLVRREGRRAWRTLVDQLSQGLAPTRAAVDGAVILLGGVLLITPGFVTDFLGFLCVLPVTRPLVRRVVVGWVGHRSRTRLRRAEAPGAPSGPRPYTRVAPEVIEGHVSRVVRADQQDEEG